MSENTQAQAENNVKAEPTLSDEINTMLDDFVDIAVQVGRAAGKAAEDLTGLMVMRVGKTQRDELDVLVNAGLAKTRAEAALKLLADGVKANEPLYGRVEHTRAQIQALKGQLKGLFST